MWNELARYHTSPYTVVCLGWVSSYRRRKCWIWRNESTFGTGVVSREEFEIAFGPDDDWQKEWEEEDRVNAAGGGNNQHQNTNGITNMNMMMESQFPSNRDVIPVVTNDSIDDLLGGAGPPLPRYDHQPAPRQPKKKVNTTANVSIDDGTGLGDWASMGMAATLPDIAVKKTASTATKLSGHVPSRDDPFGLGSKRDAAAAPSAAPPQPEMLAFEDWLSGDVSSSHSQTQRNSTNQFDGQFKHHAQQSSVWCSCH